MKRLFLVMAAIAMLCLGVAANAGVVIDMYSASAPNVFSSAPYPTWWSNAQTAIRTGVTDLGVGDAKYVQLSSTGTSSEALAGYNAIATGFDSWKGVAGGTGEWGHRIHFVYHIYDTSGADVSLANIHGIDVLENGWGDTAYSHFGSVNFNTTTVFDLAKRVGYDANGALVTSGNSAKHIIGNFGMAYAAYFNTNPAGPLEYWQQVGDTQQNTLNNAIADIDANLHSWTAVMSYDSVSANTTALFKGQDAAVPEPMSIMLGIMGLGSVTGFRRLRRK